MIQCFVKKEYEAPFGLTQMPRLFSVSRTDEKASAHPRVMHAHDDLVEIVLVRGGESRYFVGGTPYEARRGDLFIFNSRVVHDEPSGPDRPVATSSLALGGLAVPGLRENTLIAEDSCPVCRLTEPQTVRLEHLSSWLLRTKPGAWASPMRMPPWRSRNGPWPGCIMGQGRA